jgi:hypothetical protein
LVVKPSVAIHRRYVHGGSDRFKNRGRWGKVRIAGAKVDDVDSTRQQIPLLLRNRRQRILRQRLKSSGEFRH